MYSILTFKTLLVLIIIGVVSNQVIDRFDYPKIWFDKNNNKIAEPPEYRALTQTSSSDKVRTRGMGTDIKAFIKSGLCIAKCVWKYANDCPGAISCAWKCIAPPDDTPPDPPMIDKQNDVEIDVEVNTIATEENKGLMSALNPTDIVNFFICLRKCMTKYLPYTKVRLQQFIVCLSFRCFCGPK